MIAKTSSLISLSENIPDIWNLLNDRERETIALNTRVVDLNKNEPIYQENEVPSDLICLCKGKVKIFKEGVGGRIQIIRIMSSGQYFGYRAYFAEEVYATNATAFEPATLCYIPMKIVETLTTQNTKLALLFIKSLAYDLGLADERVVSLTQKHIRGRLAESLLFLLDNYGLEEDGATISIYLSREDIANLSNMTTANAIRTLSIFVDERIITLDGRKIKVIDEEQLRKISKIG